MTSRLGLVRQKKAPQLRGFFNVRLSNGKNNALTLPADSVSLAWCFVTAFTAQSFMFSPGKSSRIILTIAFIAKIAGRNFSMNGQVKSPA
ncbi:hypothetical protein AFK69_17770 [Xenorhabdus sp. GDc328]|nr:hypothetical protein AAY47_10500 [Xenorhabdus griffiniae]KOP32017.1 hypothetical protein AFK69_17770 [Xenorhabdus sp. GDc328]